MSRPLLPAELILSHPLGAAQSCGFDTATGELLPAHKRGGETRKVLERGRTSNFGVAAQTTGDGDKVVIYNM